MATPTPQSQPRPRGGGSGSGTWGGQFSCCGGGPQGPGRSETGG